MNRGCRIVLSSLALTLVHALTLGAGGIRPLTPSLEEFVVEDEDVDCGSLDQCFPNDISIVNDQTGDFVIVWTDQLPDDQIYFKRFDSFGNLVDGNSLLDPEGVISQGGQVSVDGLGNGDFLVVWNDQRPGPDPSSSSVFGQYVRNDGSIPGHNETLDDIPDGSTEGPEISLYDYSPSDGLVEGYLSWVAVYALGGDADDVYAREIVISPGSADWLSGGSASEHLDASANGFDGAQDMTVDKNGLFTIVWHRGEEGYENDKIKFSTFWYDVPMIDRGIFFENPFFHNVSYPCIGTYHSSLPDTAYVVTWLFNGIKAQVYDSTGASVSGLIDVFSGATPSNGYPRVSTFKTDDDFIITWPQGASNDAADVKARAYNRNGSQVLYDGTVQVGTTTGGNINPKIDTFKDRVYITWVKDIGGVQKVYASILTVDTTEPAISEPSDNLDPEATVYNEGGSSVATVHTTVVDEGARINAGLESVYLVYNITQHWGETVTDSVIMGDPTDPSQPPQQDTFFGNLPMPDHPGSEIYYFIRARDEAENVARNPNNPSQYHGPIYVRELGDLNGDGCHTYVDYDIIDRIIDETLPDPTPIDSFFADVDQNDLIDQGDLDSLDILIGPYPHIGCIAWAPTGPPLEVAATYGEPGETNVLVPVYLDNDSSEVSTASLLFEYDSTVFAIPTLQQTSRSQGIPYSFESLPNEKKLNLMGDDSTYIDPGEGAILKLKVNVAPGAPEGSYHFNILQAAAMDTSGKDLLVQPLRGKFFIPEPPPVSLICTPLSDTTIWPGDSLRFNTTVTNHSDSTMSPKFFIYGTTAGPDSFTFLAVDTTQIMMLAPGGRKSDITDLEVPTDAPVGHYIFTAYVVSSVTDSTFDDDPFEFQVNGQSRPGYGGNELVSSGRDMRPWRVQRGWFGYNEREGGGAEKALSTSPLPKAFSLSQNYPNPFNPSTTIRFDVPEGHLSVPVNVAVYDLRGRLVRKLLDEQKTPGRYQIHWDGRDERDRKVSSGVYLYRITAGEFIFTRKMVMVQ